MNTAHLLLVCHLCHACEVLACNRAQKSNFLKYIRYDTDYPTCQTLCKIKSNLTTICVGRNSGLKPPRTLINCPGYEDFENIPFSKLHYLQRKRAKINNFFKYKTLYSAFHYKCIFSITLSRDLSVRKTWWSNFGNFDTIYYQN